MSKVVVHEAKTAIKKFRSRNINTSNNEGQSHNYGTPTPEPKCFNAASDYKKIQKDIKLKGGLK